VLNSGGIRSLLWSPIGDWRVQLAWRLFGFAMCQAVTGETIWPRIGGVVLILLGPRLITLALASACGALLLRSLLTYPTSAILSPAEEHLVFFGLPLMAILVAWTTRRDRAQADAAQVALLRLSAAILMFFVGFHKLNSDFFLDAYSCADSLGERLDKAWRIPLNDLGILPKPVFIVSMELACSLLLLVAPRIGILLTAGLLTPIALFGPTSLVSTVMSLAIAGLSARDGHVIAAGLQKRWYMLLLLWSGVSALVYFLYVGAIPIRILVFCLVGAGILFLTALSLIDDWRGPPREPLLLHQGPARWVLIGFVAMGLANGFSPYLGVKTKMSFAMFSNLRVDDDRWNHFLVPRSVYRRTHDPFIRVERIEVLSRSGKRVRSKVANPGRHELSEAMYSPESLRHRVEVLRQRKRNANLTLRYRGQVLRFARVTTNPNFDQWLDELRGAKLFQRTLAKSAPQHCIH
jgi:hypothetical protein